MKKALAIVVLVFFAAAGVYAVLGEDADINVGSPPNPAVGKIIHASEKTIVIQTDSGEEYTFVNQQDVPVEHLEEHKTDKDEVSIQWRTDGDSRVATRVDDAL